MYKRQDDDAAVALVQQAVADDGVLAALLELHAQEHLAGLHGNAVVTHMDVHADDAGVLAAFGVDAVGVGGVVEMCIRDRPGASRRSCCWPR